MKKIAFFAILVFIFAGCMKNPDEKIFSRVYEFNKEHTAKASVASFQDLGFIISKADYENGLIEAFKLDKGQAMNVKLAFGEENSQTLVATSAIFNNKFVQEEEIMNNFFQVLDKAMFFEQEGI